MFKTLGKAGETIYKFRYLIAMVILVCGVLLEISGSSIGCWAPALEGTYEDSEKDMQGNVLGKSRSLRTDEWAVNTPMTFSQEYNYGGVYPYYSDTIRGDKTDVFIVYGQPVMSWKMIFRPFQIGYLFLGSSMGMAFFWCARVLALFLVSLEFGMYLTKKKKPLSISYALLVTGSPIIAWWFAINGLVDMLVFGQLAILFFVQWMHVKPLWKKLLLTLGIAWCGVSYILIFYPAWQVPLGYVFLSLLVGIILKERRAVEWDKRTVFLSLAVLLIAMGAALGIVFMKSWDTIQLVLNTAYPGKRTSAGGGSFMRMFAWAGGMFFPYLQDLGLGASNVCEEAGFFSFFPLGFLLGLIAVVKNKKKDPLLISMLMATVFLALYCAIPWPSWLSKVTLLNMGVANRILIGVGFLSILMLIYVVANGIDKIKMSSAIVTSVVISAGLAVVCMFFYTTFMGEKKALVVFCVLAVGMFLIFNAMIKRRYGVMAAYAFVVAMTVGMTVNPIHRGVDSIYESKLTQSIEEMTEKDMGKGFWIVDGLSAPYQNLPMCVGAPTINTTNVYPNLERWKSLDSDKRYEKIYNRYAHINITIVNDSYVGDAFQLLEADNFLVNLKVEQLETLNVSHVMTLKELESFNTDEVKFELADQVGRFFIYNVSYN